LQDQLERVDRRQGERQAPSKRSDGLSRHVTEEGEGQMELIGGDPAEALEVRLNLLAQPGQGRLLGGW
jgi:hypothetical protein